MPRFVWVQVSNPKNKYITTVTADPNVPAGYALTNTQDGSWMGVDGVHDDNSQVFVGGLWSGGYPAYNGYTDGSATNGKLGGN
jgi:hypothetical protein